MNSQQRYWSNPKDKPNKPESYAKNELNERSYFLYKLIQPLIKSNNSIMEIGCNVGRNLNFLFNNGYQNLSGIEINENAIKLMKQIYPSLVKKANIKVGTIENILPIIKDKFYDLTISFAVMMHLPYESNFALVHLARITKKYIVLVEDERKEILGDRHFPRNYKEFFNYAGFEEVSSGQCTVEELKNYTWRVLKRR